MIIARPFDYLFQSVEVNAPLHYERVLTKIAEVTVLFLTGAESEDQELLLLPLRDTSC